MRVIRITQDNNFKSINFDGRKKRKERQNSQDAAGMLSSYYETFRFPYYSPNTSQGRNIVKSEHPFRESYFDFDKLANLHVENTENIAPKPFSATHANFKLDKYQKEAIDSYISGKTTVVCAPTGTGKTLIAEHVIDDALKNGKKIIYLSPLKALSNEKYTDFAKLFGTYDEKGNLKNTNNVGLLTGDTAINPSAPVLVMTTEIFRNSLVSGTAPDGNVDWNNYDGVVYDEFHYLGDKQRGTVWEEAVMYTPKNMKQLMLSATASNAQEICTWAGDLNKKIETHLVNVPEQERHVPLRELVLTETSDGRLTLEDTKTQRIDVRKIENKINLSDRQMQALERIKEITEAQTEEEVTGFMKSLADKKNILDSKRLASALIERGAEQDEADAISLILSNKTSTIYNKTPEGEINPNPKLSRVIKLLDKKQMTPALFYIFSKKGCNKELLKAAENSESLLTPEESKMVYDEVQKCKEKGVFLGADFDDEELEALMKGFAVHHAGRLPAYKSLVENLARQGLVKACFATETLIAGINMPFRTTVFTSLEKYDGEEIDYITTQTFKQGAGRAGRRGKDEIGNVVIMPKSYEDYDTYLSLTKSTNTSINSKYDISYASLLSDKMLNNIDEILLSSFAAHQRDSELDNLEANCANRLELLELKGYIEKDENGIYKRTEKGEIAKNVFGINEILLTELLTDPTYLKDFASNELIALCASLSDVKDENPSREFTGDTRYMQNSMDKIFNLVDEIDNFENYEMIKCEPTKLSTTLVPYIINFAEAPHSREEAIKSWTQMMDELKENETLTHEGDMLRIINGTKDILKLINKLSPDSNIQEQASVAMEKLTKPPVVDIFNYELAE